MLLDQWFSNFFLRNQKTIHKLYPVLFTNQNIEENALNDIVLVIGCFWRRKSPSERAEKKLPSTHKDKMENAGKINQDIPVFMWPVENVPRPNFGSQARIW